MEDALARRPHGQSRHKGLDSRRSSFAERIRRGRLRTRYKANGPETIGAVAVDVFWRLAGHRLGRVAQRAFAGRA